MAMNQLIEHEQTIRLAVFVSVLALMLILEQAIPKKHRVSLCTKRWLNNLGLIVISTGLVKILVPIFAVTAAIFSAEHGYGLLNQFGLALWLKIIVACVLLDVLIYAQHVVSHKMPILWRFHRVHHTDRDLDATSGFRFHPIEIIFSMLFKIVCVVAIGAPLIAVIIFEILLNACAIFNHANVRLKPKIDRLLRKIIVTPDMHRVHHSIIPSETDRNFGFFLSFWDKLFNTYQAQPQNGHDNMALGLSEYQNDQPLSLTWCLRLPFQKH